jgi:hypothetical protein
MFLHTKVEYFAVGGHIGFADDFKFVFSRVKDFHFLDRRQCPDLVEDFLGGSIFDADMVDFMALGLLTEGSCGAVGHDLAFVDDEDAVTGGFHLGQDMGAEEDGFVAAGF